MDTEEEVNQLYSELPNVLQMLREEHWTGSDEDIVKGITLMANVLRARHEQAEDHG
jgi:hypothetical protein